MNTPSAPIGPSRDSERSLARSAIDLVQGSRSRVAKTLPTAREQIADSIEEVYDAMEDISDVYGGSEDEK